MVRMSPRADAGWRDLRWTLRNAENVILSGLHVYPIKSCAGISLQRSDLGATGLRHDRRESLGTKFKDADLIGAPLRLTLTSRSLRSGGVEIKARSDAESFIVSTDEAVSLVKLKIAALESDLSPGDSIASAPDESLA